MSLEIAKRYAIRSLNYEDGVRVSKKDVLFNEHTKRTEVSAPPIILEELMVDSGAGDKETLNRLGVKKLQVQKLHAWRANAENYPNQILEEHVVLKKAKEEFVYHLNPEKHNTSNVYPRIHKRAARLVEISIALMAEYWDQKHQDDLEALEMITAGLLQNAKLTFDGIVSPEVGDRILRS
jgi:hypothetical protein